MKRPPAGFAAYLAAHYAAIGAKGGKATGPAKARDPAHYKRLADMKRAKAKCKVKP